MSIVKNIQTYFFKKQLAALSQTERQGHTLLSAKHIALLFDASSISEKNTVQEQRDFWVNEGKQVFMLGYIDNKQTEAIKTEYLNILTPKEFAWHGVLKKEALKLPGKQDLLLCFNPNEKRALHFLSSAIQADMKVGNTPETGIDHNFDLILELPPSATAKDFFENLSTYLNTIQQKHT